VYLVHADKDTQGECGVDVGLADIENLRIIFGQYAHYRSRQSRAVLTCDSHEYLFLTILLFHFHSFILCAKVHKKADKTKLV
jgi:hypothetical protein